MTTRKVTRSRRGAAADPAPIDVEIEIDDDGGERASATPSSEPRTEPDARAAHGTFTSSSRSGRYELAYELASGGMATVYLARFEAAAGFSRPVALKRIHPHLARDPRFVDMFLDEARISARLSHPNVCAVHDFGQDDDGGYYLAMEYLAGETLASVMRAALRRGSPADPRYRRYLAYLLAEAARGLHAAHETRGADGRVLDIVHRDVTPNNLFVTFDGVVKVVDFGIAKARDRVTQTDTGELKGSLPYVSPEHARSGAADRRADVWSLGVCAWEALTGRRLFKRPTQVDTLYAVLEAPIAHVTEVQPAVPRAYGDAIARALEREPSQRYGTAKELGDALMAASDVDGARPTASEIGAWLDELFPGGRDARHRLVESTLRSEGGVLPITTSIRAARVAPAVQTRAAPARALWAAIGLAGVAILGGVAWQWRTPTTSATPTPSAPATTLAAPPSEVGIEREAVPSAPSAAPAADAPTADAPTADAPTADAPTADAPAADAPASHRARATPTHERTPSPPPSATPPVARTAAPHETSAATGDGTVVIVVPDGWADVYEGARRLGTTPLRTTLSASGHDLDVRIEGHAPGRRVHTDVRAGETTRLVVRASD